MKDNVIIVYSRSLEYGLNVLRHEFLDSLISEAVKSYVDIINAPRKMINALLQDLGEKAYRHKENMTEPLENLLKNRK